LFVPVELGVGDETRVVVDEGKQEHLPFLVRVGGVGEIGTVHGVSLPQVAKVVTFEASIGLRPLLVEELRGGGMAESQMAAECTGRDGLLGDRVGPVEGEDLDDGTRGAMGLLAFERLGAIKGLFGDSTGLTAVGAGLGFEPIESVLAVELLPAGKGGRTDGGARGTGNIVVAAGDPLAQPLLTTGRVLAAQEGQNERVAEKGDLGASVFGFRHGWASLTQVGSSVPEAGGSRNAKVCWSKGVISPQLRTAVRSAYVQTQKGSVGVVDKRGDQKRRGGTR
jgi:hypothetical protein